MKESFFIWNGVDCRALGMKLAGPVAIVRPEERIQHVEIPGRSGDMTETQGADVFNSYIQTASIMVHGGYRVRDVYKWLRGAGYVTFSGEPDRRQAARIIGAITLNKQSRNLDWWVGEVQFYCQPLKQLLFEERDTIASSGSSAWNSGDVTSRPMWRVTPGGSSITLTVTGDGTPEDNAITVTGLTANSIIWIDSDTMEILNSDRTALLTKNSSGNFPVMAPGENVITGTGWNKIIIEKRERYL